jgi:hypothetical protein
MAWVKNFDFAFAKSFFLFNETSLFIKLILQYKYKAFAEGERSLKHDLEVLRMLYACDFKSKEAENYFAYFRNNKKSSFFTFNHRVWQYCKQKINTSRCYDPELYKMVCPYFPTRIAKVVRITANDIQDILLDPEVAQYLKIVVLMRDPRSVVSSNLKMFCLSNCSSVNLTIEKCDVFARNLQGFQWLNCHYPEKVHLLRYEDLSLKPNRTLQRLFQFLDLPLVENVEKFVDENSKGSETLSKFKKHLNFKIIQTVQEHCSSMGLLGYEKFETEHDFLREKEYEVKDIDSSVFKCN